MTRLEGFIPFSIPFEIDSERLLAECSATERVQGVRPVLRRASDAGMTSQTPPSPRKGVRMRGRDVTGPVGPASP